jgi:hypothetical protein
MDDIRRTLQMDASKSMFYLEKKTLVLVSNLGVPIKRENGICD